MELIELTHALWPWPTRKEIKKGHASALGPTSTISTPSPGTRSARISMGNLYQSPHRNAKTNPIMRVLIRWTTTTSPVSPHHRPTRHNKSWPTTRMLIAAATIPVAVTMPPGGAATIIMVDQVTGQDLGLRLMVDAVLAVTATTIGPTIAATVTTVAVAKTRSWWQSPQQP